MALNICKYQVPYVQYNLFADYIAENLCVNRYDEDSCCRGKCFLEKQINRVNDADGRSANPVEKKPVLSETDDFIPDHDPLPASIHFSVRPLSGLTDNRLRKLSLDVAVPPPERFI
jgi:hypothetical protein